MAKPPSDHDIITDRMQLICCDRAILEALFNGANALSDLLEVTIPDRWTEFGEPAFRFTYKKIMEGSARIQWWSYLPVLKNENILVGSCGYKGNPAAGMVEIGYEVAAAYRGKGLATEMAGALIHNAFQSDEVECVRAHTLAGENESVSVLKKSGMKKIAELNDPEDGKIWRWELWR